MTVVDGAVASLRCAFCGARPWAGRLIAGWSAAICEHCIAVCHREVEASPSRAGPGPSPRLLLAEMERRVVGQEAAKRVLAVAGYRHHRRRQLHFRHGEAEWLPKANILLVGPSGSGKTRLVETLGQALAVPCVPVDVSALTRAGYHGEDVDSIAERLLDAANGDPDEARFGIVHLEGVDKLAACPSSWGPDVKGAGVQQGLLAMLEGTGISLARPHRRADAVLETSDVLFVASGVFEGIERIVESRCGAGRLPAVEPADLMTFGLLPEFVGRFPVVVPFEPPDEAVLVRILTEPEDAPLRQYRTLLSMSGVRLDAAPEALRAIAREALRRGTGARALRSVLDEVLLDLMFEAPSRDDLSAVRLEGGDFETLRPVLSVEPAGRLRGGGVDH